jgi:hypothetical protein
MWGSTSFNLFASNLEIIFYKTFQRLIDLNSDTLVGFLSLGTRAILVAFNSSSICLEYKKKKKKTKNNIVYLPSNRRPKYFRKKYKKVP